MKKAKVLVTGSEGYLGSVLCPLLTSAGHEVRGLDITPPASANAGFEKITGDVCDPEILKPLVEKSDVIIPLAALVGAPVCALRTEDTKRINLESIRVLNNLRGQRLVIFPMTNNGYKPSQEQPYADEKTFFGTDSLYTETKYQAEQLLLKSGNTVSLRLASLFGPAPAIRWDLLLHHFIRQALETGKISLFEGGFKRSFVHVQDAAGAFLFALEHADKMKNEIYNVSLQEGNLSKSELAQHVTRCLPGTEIITDTKSKDPDSRNFFISIEKLKQAGYECQRTVDSGIREILNSLKKAPLPGAKT